MWRKTIVVSDLSGKEIDGGGAQVIIRYRDGTRGQVVLDVAVAEVEELAARGRRQPRRRRKSKAQVG